MADYATMYKTLFQSQTKAIALLQEAQRETEKMYIDAPETEIRLFPSKQDTDSTDEN
jgi:hypothetical protein